MQRARAPWWMFAVAASFLAYVSLVTYQSFWGPNGLTEQFASVDFAFIRGKGMVVVAGHQAGLQPDDRILAVNGQTIRNAHDWNAIRANTEVGRPELWEIARGDRRLQLEQTFDRGTRSESRAAERLLNLDFPALV